jgi:hypothetical protein
VWENKNLHPFALGLGVLSEISGGCLRERAPSTFPLRLALLSVPAGNWKRLIKSLLAKAAARRQEIDGKFLCRNKLKLGDRFGPGGSSRGPRRQPNLLKHFAAV